MPLARRLSLMLVLLAIPSAGVAHASPEIPPEPCNTVTDRDECVGTCIVIDSVLTDCRCYWDGPDDPLPFPQDATTGCTAGSTCCWNAPCSQWSSFGDTGNAPTEVACFYGGGGLGEGDPGGPAPSNCVADAATDECRCTQPRGPAWNDPVRLGLRGRLRVRAGGSQWRGHGR